MLFVTNRRLNEGRRSAAGRAVSFDATDSEPGASLFFCRRLGADQYEEVLAAGFFSRLRRSPRRQILLVTHGFNCQPERDIFPRAVELQSLCDRLAPDLVEVVPLIWPCDDDFGVVLDYWDDQASAEISGHAFARLIGKFFDWRDRTASDEVCLKHVNLLAHSMGNRMLRAALAKWAGDYGAPPAIFRNIFMMAADVANECLEAGRDGAVIPASARNLVVYHAADDLALRSSKVANLRNKIVTRRLGHTGPERIGHVPANVTVVDCDGFNSAYDRLGHTYFLGDPGGRPGTALRHIVETMRTGRPAAGSGPQRLVLEEAPAPANSNATPVRAA